MEEFNFKAQDYVFDVFSSACSIASHISASLRVKNERVFTNSTKSPETVSAETESQPAKCPYCGTEVLKAEKVETMIARLVGEPAERFQLTVGFFDCPKCKKTFRVVQDKRKLPMTPS